MTCQFANPTYDEERRRSQRAMSHYAGRHADHQAATMHAGMTRSISILGCLVHNLIESRKDVVGKLHLGHRAHALARRTNRKAHQSLLTQRRVEDSLSAKVCGEIHGTPKDTTKLDIFAEDKDALVGLEGMAQGFVHGSVQIYALCLALADVFWEFGVLEGGA